MLVESCKNLFCCQHIYIYYYIIQCPVILDLWHIYMHVHIYIYTLLQDPRWCRWGSQWRGDIPRYHVGEGIGPCVGQVACGGHRLHYRGCRVRQRPAARQRLVEERSLEGVLQTLMLNVLLLSIWILGSN